MATPADTKPYLPSETAAPNGEIRIRFGPKPDQTVPRMWADRILSKLAADHRPVFVKLLGDAALGVEPTP